MTRRYRTIRQTVFNLAAWVIPHRAYVAFMRPPGAPATAAGETPELRAAFALAAGNAVLHDKHAGERCFVLCNGPSVRKQNLRLLKGEAVISVSNGYHHPDYGFFRPRYHCLPQVTYGAFTEADAVEWFREMHGKLGGAELFLNYTEEPLVRRFSLFPGRTVRYVVLDGHMDSLHGRGIPDLSKSIPRVQSVSVMCLMLAMYLGFRTIYLLGTDHDQFKTGEYTYFYEPSVLRGKDPDVNADGKVVSKRYDEFQALARLWRQYRTMREIAERHGLKIWNATAGGELDEFPRVDLERVLEK